MPATDNKTVFDNHPEHLTPWMPFNRLSKSVPAVSSQEMYDSEIKVNDGDIALTGCQRKKERKK